MTVLSNEELDTLNTYNLVDDEWINSYTQPGFWQAEMRRFKQLLPGGTILEIGTGGAQDAMELMDLGYDYVGIEPAEKLYKKAQNRLPGVRLYQQDAYNLSFPDGQKFDGFWASRSLLHVEHIDDALQSMRSVLKPKAIGFISLIDGEGKGMEVEKWGDGRTLKRFFAYYPKAEFTQILQRNGFRVADYSYRPDSDRFRWHCFFVEAE